VGLNLLIPPLMGTAANEQWFSFIEIAEIPKETKIEIKIIDGRKFVDETTYFRGGTGTYYKL
jgi:hypothetical protein